MSYDSFMDTISQRELRNDNAQIMRRVEAGESFVVTRNGRPVADVVPHHGLTLGRSQATLGQIQEVFSHLPPMDSERWRREREADDKIFGSDDPFSEES
jgi:prevent-host-death family protein